MEHIALLRLPIFTTATCRAIPIYLNLSEEHMFEDDRIIPIVCPHCGNHFQEQIGRLKFQTELACHKCSRVFNYKKDDFVTALYHAQHAVDELYRVLGVKKD